MTKQRVLFLCTGNSARSQMAEAMLRKYAGNRFEVYSAGLEPKGLNPYMIKVMEEAGYDMSLHFSKSINSFDDGKATFDFLITVCGDAEKKCPYFPRASTRFHWPIEDPAEFLGSPEEILQKFREIRGQIEGRVQSWIRRGDKPNDEMRVLLSLISDC
jgi:arsenate reductase